MSIAHGGLARILGGLGTLMSMTPLPEVDMASLLGWLCLVPTAFFGRGIPGLANTLGSPSQLRINPHSFSHCQRPSKGNLTGLLTAWTVGLSPKILAQASMSP